jgi:hypothetical protein
MQQYLPYWISTTKNQLPLSFQARNCGTYFTLLGSLVLLEANVCQRVLTRSTVIRQSFDTRDVPRRGPL